MIRVESSLSASQLADAAAMAVITMPRVGSVAHAAGVGDAVGRENSIAVPLVVAEMPSWRGDKKEEMPTMILV